MSNKEIEVVVVGARQDETQGKGTASLNSLRKDPAVSRCIEWRSAGKAGESMPSGVELVLYNRNIGDTAKWRLTAVTQGKGLRLVEKIGTDAMVLFLLDYFADRPHPHQKPAGGASAEGMGTAPASAGPQAQDEGEEDSRQALAEGEREAMITAQSALPQALRVPDGQKIYVVGLNQLATVKEVDKPLQFCRLSRPEANKVLGNWPSDLAVLVIMGTVEGDVVDNLGSMAAQRRKMCIAIPGWKVSHLREWLKTSQIQWGWKQQPAPMREAETPVIVQVRPTTPSGVLSATSPAGGTADQATSVSPAPEQRFVYKPGMSTAQFVVANYDLATEIGGEGCETRVLICAGKGFGLTSGNIAPGVTRHRQKRGITVPSGYHRGLPEGVEERILALLLPTAKSELAPPPLPAEPAESDPILQFEPSPAASADGLDDPQLRTAFRAITNRLMEMTLAVMDQKIARLEQENARLQAEVARLKAGLLKLAGE